MPDNELNLRTSVTNHMGMSEIQKKADLESVKTFMSQKHIAIVGVSRNNKKFGNTIFKELHIKEYHLYPIHKELQIFVQNKCYHDLEDLPPEVSASIVCTKPQNAHELIRKAIKKNIHHIWLQQGAQDNNAIKIAKSKNLNIIHRECILMFTEPVVGIHKFHRGINKIFGAYPR